MTTTEQAILQAMQNIGTGQLNQAEQICQKLLETQPHNPEALHVHGLVAYMRRDYDKAIEQISHAIEIENSNPQFFANLGEALRRTKRPIEALEKFERAILIKPEFLKAHLGLGNCLRDLERFEGAISKFRLALAIDNSFAEAYHYLGVTYMEVDRLEDAIPVLRKAVAMRPAYSEAQMSLASALEKKGESEEALSVYQAMLERDEKNVAVHNNVGNILKNMGKIYDDQGQFDKAFPHFEKDNDLDNRGEEYNTDRHSLVVNRLISIFNQGFLDNKFGMGSETELPIFVLGMSRSGTTLVEQLLASHPEVHGAGELSEIGRIVGQLPKLTGSSLLYPECVPELDAATACKAAEEYISYLNRESGGAKRVTDKMPGNFLHMGLISLLLPKAKIIHCHREPLDVCLSCYFQHFTAIMPFSRNLKDLGRYYSDYEKVMAHWKKTMPMPVLDVRYEDMISDHESMGKKIIDFCGLEWDEACLAFYATERPVKTASSWQVRQPIYTSSLARWKNYEPNLTPLKEALPG